MCEFRDSNCNGFGDMWWTDKCIYFSSIDGQEVCRQDDLICYGKTLSSPRRSIHIHNRRGLKKKTCRVIRLPWDKPRMSNYEIFNRLEIKFCRESNIIYIKYQHACGIRSGNIVCQFLLECFRPNS